MSSEYGLIEPFDTDDLDGSGSEEHSVEGDRVFVRRRGHRMRFGLMGVTVLPTDRANVGRARRGLTPGIFGRFDSFSGGRPPKRNKSGTIAAVPVGRITSVVLPPSPSRYRSLRSVGVKPKQYRRNSG